MGTLGSRALALAVLSKRRDGHQVGPAAYGQTPLGLVTKQLGLVGVTPATLVGPFFVEVSRNGLKQLSKRLAVFGAGPDEVPVGRALNRRLTSQPSHLAFESVACEGAAKVPRSEQRAVGMLLNKCVKPLLEPVGERRKTRHAEHPRAIPTRDAHDFQPVGYQRRTQTHAVRHNDVFEVTNLLGLALPVDVEPPVEWRSRVEQGVPSEARVSGWHGPRRGEKQYVWRFGAT